MDASTARYLEAVSRAAPAPRFSYQRRLLRNVAFAIGGDVVALVAALLVADFIRSLVFGPMMVPRWVPLILGFWVFGGAVLHLYPGWGLSPVALLQRLTILATGVFGATGVFLFMSQMGSATSRFSLLLTFVLATLLVPLARIAIKSMLCTQGTWGLPAVIYGSGATAADLVERLREEGGTGYIPCGCFTAQNEHIGGLPRLGGMNEVTQAAPLAILSTAGLAPQQVERLLHGPLAHYRRVLLVWDVGRMPNLWVHCRDLGGIPGFELSQNLLDPWRQLLKRSVDLTLTLGTLPLWGPLLGIGALLIWLEDRQTPFFLQNRIGLNGRTFRTWKFRTMQPDAEAILREKLDHDGEFRKQWENGYKVKEDPRITRVGRILRRASFDELPQLINVLRGEMSLVGPRPLPSYHHEGLPDDVRELRERVRPGITGLWQVSGRSDCGDTGMIRWDPYYVQNWSTWLDIVVLVRTVRAVIRGSGAY